MLRPSQWMMMALGVLVVLLGVAAMVGGTPSFLR
jgi:hypothetical protein